MIKQSELFAEAEQLRQTAMEVLAVSRLVEIWERAGGTVNLVGSARSDLMMKNRDLDMHVYTDEPLLEKSFSVMAEFGPDPAVRAISYRNGLDTEEVCVEWHIDYEYGGDSWKMDIIHIRKGSAYDGVIERTTDAIIAKLTPETREAILRIKYERPAGVFVPGIEIYYAVLAVGARNYREFAAWKENNAGIDLLGWMPE